MTRDHPVLYQLVGCAMVKAKELKILRKRLGAANKLEDPLQLLECDGKSSKAQLLGINSAGIDFLLDYKSSADLASTRPSGEDTAVAATAAVSASNLMQQCLDLFEQNMGDLYRNSSWGLNMDAKRDEFQNKTARFLLVSDTSGSTVDQTSTDKTNTLAAFVHFRFCYDDDDDPEYAVLYVYEIQVHKRYQRLGLGGRVMTILESIAMQLGLTKVMLTAFHKNTEAVAFYRDKLSYSIDPDSPSQHGKTAEYEILSKRPR